jgi:hypothetical protein
MGVTQICGKHSLLSLTPVYRWRTRVLGSCRRRGQADHALRQKHLILTFSPEYRGEGTRNRMRPALTRPQNPAGTNGIVMYGSPSSSAWSSGSFNHSLYSLKIAARLSASFGSSTTIPRISARPLMSRELSS